MRRIAALLFAATSLAAAAAPATAGAAGGISIGKETVDSGMGAIFYDFSFPLDAFTKSTDTAKVVLVATATSKGKTLVVGAESWTFTYEGGRTTARVGPLKGAALKLLKAKRSLPITVKVTFTLSNGAAASTLVDKATLRLDKFKPKNCGPKEIKGVPTRAGVHLSLYVFQAGGISCGKAAPVALAWGKCGLAPGVSGVCATKLSGFKCKSSGVGDGNSGSDDELTAGEDLSGQVRCEDTKHRTIYMGFSRETPGISFTNCPVAGATAYPIAGGSYTAFGASGTSCANAYAVAKAHATCRNAKGPQGRCVTKVLGYSCQEIRENNTSARQFTATVTCQNGAKAVRYEYTQTY
jgi:hypothetical protein